VSHDLSVELGRLLDQFDENRRAVEQRKRQVKADEDAFREGFARLRASVIRPVFEAAGAILKARQHDFSVTEDEAVEGGSGAGEAAICIRVMPAGTASTSLTGARFPSLCFVTRHYNKTVCVLASNAVPMPSGPAGSRGDYRLAQIDAELVQAELLKLIAGIVNT